MSEVTGRCLICGVDWHGLDEWVEHRQGHEGKRALRAEGRTPRAKSADRVALLSRPPRGGRAAPSDDAA